MTSFFDLFKWDRFVATSVIELLFWLLAAIAVLFGISGLLNGVALVQLAPVSALLAIAFSIIGTLAAIVAARVVCEAVIMLFRLNENLMDIRDHLAPPAERPPAAAGAAPVAEDPFVVAFEEMLPAPPAHAVSPVTAPAEGRRNETRAQASPPPEARPEGRSSETSSLEARLAEIRARREGVAAAAARAAATTAGPAATDAGLAGARHHLEEAAGPHWEADSAVEVPDEDSTPEKAMAPDVEALMAEAVKAAAAKIPERKASAPDVPQLTGPGAPEAEAPQIAAGPVKRPPMLGPYPGSPVPRQPSDAVPEVHATTASHPENSVPEVKAPAAQAAEPRHEEARKPDTPRAVKFSEDAVVKAIEAALVAEVAQVPRDEVSDAADRLVDEAIKSLSAEASASEPETTTVASGPAAGKPKTTDAA